VGGYKSSWSKRFDKQDNEQRNRNGGAGVEIRKGCFCVRSGENVVRLEHRKAQGYKKDNKAKEGNTKNERRNGTVSPEGGPFWEWSRRWLAQQRAKAMDRSEREAKVDEDQQGRG